MIAWIHDELTRLHSYWNRYGWTSIGKPRFESFQYVLWIRSRSTLLVSTCKYTGQLREIIGFLERSSIVSRYFSYNRKLASLWNARDLEKVFALSYSRCSCYVSLALRNKRTRKPSLIPSAMLISFAYTSVVTFTISPFRSDWVEWNV